MSTVPPSLAPDVPSDARSEAQSVLPTAEALVARHFPNVTGRRVTWEHDPETGESWLELRLVVREDPATVADAYDRYVAQWVAAVPWPQHNRVRVSYRID